MQLNPQPAVAEPEHRPAHSGPRALFVSHGGGPLPLLGDSGHAEMLSCLQTIAASLAKPSAIIVVSAHWEATVPTITAGDAPPLIYDYYGFPAAAYSIEYPCAGAPALAQQVKALFDVEGIETALDRQRGFDHGLFIPLKIMYPAADIPCIQLSLASSLDPAMHLKMGEVLHGLEDENILILGSGFSYHNLSAFFSPQTPDLNAMNAAFEEWLLETCSSSDMDEGERMQRLLQWHTAPYAEHCHPRAEHLMPLHVCYGAAHRACDEAFELQILNKQASMYLWQTGR